MNVEYSPEAIIYLKNLTTILYDKGYFSYIETATNYVDKLTSNIENTIDSILKRKAPIYFSKFGRDMYYATYKPNKHTTWYVFFNYKDDRYLIRYITNNHVSAQYFKGSK
jgi:hypothetical protein